MPLELAIILAHGPVSLNTSELAALYAENLSRNIRMTCEPALRDYTVLCSKDDPSLCSALAIMPEKRPIVLESLWAVSIGVDPLKSVANPRKYLSNPDQALRDIDNYSDKEKLLIVSRRETANFLGAELSRQLLGLQNFTARALQTFEGYIVDMKNGTLSFVDSTWQEHRLIPMWKIPCLSS